jgi:hypothetical protein
MIPKMKLMDITVKRTISASAEKVFDAWMDPKCPGGPWFESAALIFALKRRPRQARSTISLYYGKDIAGRSTGALWRSSGQAKWNTRGWGKGPRAWSQL